MRFLLYQTWLFFGIQHHLFICFCKQKTYTCSVGCVHELAVPPAAESRLVLGILLVENPFLEWAPDSLHIE